MKRVSVDPLVWAFAAGLVLTGCGSGGGSSSPTAPPINNPPPVALDTDSDGVLDSLDVFPADAAASKDTDGDGFPDTWNTGATPAQLAASTLKLDAFPLLAIAAVDTDGDGRPDAFLGTPTPAQITASGLALDAFPLQAIASVDTDGDGSPDAWLGTPTLAQITASGLALDAFPLQAIAAVDTDGDGFPDGWLGTPTPTQIGVSGLTLDVFRLQPIAAVDTDGDGMPDSFLGTPTPGEVAASGLVPDAAPLLGFMDMPTGAFDPAQTGPQILASPLDFGQGVAGDFEQQMLTFEEFGPETMPPSAAGGWSPLPQPQDPQSGPDPLLLNSFLAQPGVSPLPQRLSNVDIPSPWKPAIEAFLNRTLVPPLLGVAGPAEGRPSGEEWAHQRWDELAPKTFFKTSVAPARVNQGLRDSKQMHHYGVGLPPDSTEFGTGGLYHNVAGVSATDGTTNGIGIKFHPKLPLQEPNSIWTFDGTLPPKLLMARYGEPILMRNYNALPMDEGANNGFGRHTISTHEHNGHNPGESDGYAGAFFFPGQFYDYRWPMQLAGFSDINNAAGAINPLATDPKAAIPCVAGEKFTVLVGQPPVPTERICPDTDGNGNGTVMIPGDWRETMSTHWFHDHMLDHTAENVYKGNATCMNYYSALDRGNEALNDGVNLRFPSGSALSWGNRDYDVNLVLADKAWSPTTGQLWFNTTQHNGFLGDRMTVNFLYKPFFNVRARKYRFRILNGAVSRIMAIGLVQEVNKAFGTAGAGELAGPAGSSVSYNRVPFHMIANDGNIMEHAVNFDGATDFLNDGNPLEHKGQLPSQTIAERYDIVVDFSKHGILPGDKLYFVNIMEHWDGKGTQSKVPMADIVSGKYQAIVNPDGKWVNGDPGVGKFMELRVQAYSGTDNSINLAAYEPGGATMVPLSINRHDPALNTATHHTFEFVKAGQSNGGHGEPWAIKVDGGVANGMDPHRISALEFGNLQVWTIKTGGGWTHPVHIHFEEGIILTRGGKAPPAWETWARKDMYRVGPENDSKLEVEIAYRSRDFLGEYVQHCHNTMHEDHQMLLRWDAAKIGALPMATPMPTWDGVFFQPSFFLPTAETGDGLGPVKTIP